MLRFTLRESEIPMRVVGTNGEIRNNTHLLINKCNCRRTLRCAPSITVHISLLRSTTMADITTTTTTSAATKTAPGQKKTTAPGLTFRRFFTKTGVSPYDELEW